MRTDRGETGSSCMDAYCAFERGGRAFGVPVRAVREVLTGETATPVPRAPAHIAGVVNLRGEPLPLLLVDEWIGVPSRRYRPADQILVVESSRMRVGIVVDRVLDVLRRAGVASDDGWFAGDAAEDVEQRGGGKVSLLDPDGIIRAAVSSTTAGFRRMTGSEARGAAGTVRAE